MDWTVVSTISSAVVALAAIGGLVYSHLVELRNLSGRVTRLETQIEPFWEFVRKNITDMLIKGHGNPEPLTLRDELLTKFRDGTILPHERDQLVSILEAERAQASRERDVAVLIALGLVIAALIASSGKK